MSQAEAQHACVQRQENVAHEPYVVEEYKLIEPVYESHLVGKMRPSRTSQMNCVSVDFVGT